MSSSDIGYSLELFRKASAHSLIARAEARLALRMIDQNRRSACLRVVASLLADFIAWIVAKLLRKASRVLDEAASASIASGVREAMQRALAKSWKSG